MIPRPQWPPVIGGSDADTDHDGGQQRDCGDVKPGLHAGGELGAVGEQGAEDRDGHGAAHLAEGVEFRAREAGPLGTTHPAVA